jgi:hypothetical protein
MVRGPLIVPDKRVHHHRIMHALESEAKTLLSSVRTEMRTRTERRVQSRQAVFPEGGLAYIVYARGKSGEQSASRTIFLWEEVRVLKGWSLKTRSREWRFQKIQLGRNGFSKVSRDR